MASFPGTAGGQEARTLTLEAALERAARHNPDYRMARNELELSRTEERAAWGAFLPALSLSAGTGLSFDRQLIATDFFGNPIENPITEWRASSSSAQSLSGTLSLFQGGARFHELALQGAQARAREAGAAGRFRALEAEVARTYHRALNQQALLAVEEELLAGRRLDLEMARRMFELAGASRVEILAAELNVQRQEQRIQQVEAQLQQALLTLRRVVGDPELGGFRLAGAIPEPFDPADLDADALLAGALASNAQLGEQEARLLMGEARARAARGSRWPTVSLSFGVNQRTFAHERGALFDPYPSQARYGSTSLSLNVPLFSRFQTQARVAEAEVSLANSREALRKVRLQVEEEVRSRLISLRTAYLGYRIALRSREIAEERLRLAREQYRLGSRSFTELQRDIDDAAQAEREAINQRFAFVEARIYLEETVGEGVGPATGSDSRER